VRLGLHGRAVTGASSRLPVIARRPVMDRQAPAVVAPARGGLHVSDLSKVPVTIVTGFLGAGKTTLISHLIRNAGGRRLAVVVNEFGTLGVDGDILQSCAIPDCPAENIVELANGCICCTVADDFIPTVERLLALEPRPDHILIETSGLALPKPLLKAFDWPAIRSKITVDGVLALADAEAVAAGRFAPDVAALDAQRAADPSVDHETPLSEVFEDQLACADMVLLTKVDLAGPEGVAAARAVIAAEALRPVPIIELTEGVVDPRVILGLGVAAEDDIASRPSHHDGEDDHEHDDFDSTVVALGEIADPEGLVARIEALARDHEILRIKGYAAVTGKPMRLLVQAVGARVRHQYDRPWRPDEPRETTLVAIAEQGRVDPALIRAALRG
jgi:cobalamin biosynthesis protein CobW